MSACFFFDTSALVKLYHEEAGTEELTVLVERESPVIAVSDITAVEMVSAFAKKVRTAEIDIHAFEEAFAAFQSDLSQFHVVTVESTIMARASELLKTADLKNALKTLDSLQLASALVFSERSKLDLFIAADGVLMRIAEEAGLQIMAA